MSIENREQLVKDVNELSPLYKEVEKKLHKAYERNKKHYDFRKRVLRFKKGDLVWKRNYLLSKAADNFNAKLAPKYAPCVVKEVTGPLTYRLKDENNKDVGTWHIKDLKPREIDEEEGED